jgi:xanthine dehydrogenase YagS FAD-binding subunit
MKSFGYQRARRVEEVLTALAEPGTTVIAGGTELVNWLKEGISAPDRLVDITEVDLGGVRSGPDGLRIGALTRMSELAAHPVVRAEYPVLAESLLRAASAQLRNMATIGGNLLQRTRCPYFRADATLPCNQRVPGSGCAARDGDTSAAALFGWSEHCVATHPSDLAVALAALDATVVALGPGGERRIPVTEFHRLPGDEPWRYHELRPDELVTEVLVPAEPSAARSHYLKVRERVSYEFAVVSAAAVVRLADSPHGTEIVEARLALGGVAHRPWRLYAAEQALRGRDLRDREGLLAGIAESFADARSLPGNAYKLELAPRAAVRALQTAGGLA